MAIETLDQLVNALANNSSRFVIDKASIASAAAGQIFSLWRATGVPGQGAIPAAAAICTSALVGSFGFANQTAPSSSYIGWLFGTATNNATNLEIHDRLAHVGGLSGIVTTAQGALTLAGLDAYRLGAANYSNVQWWLEIYQDLGATGVNATVNVTYNDDTSEALTAFALGASPRAGRLYPLVPKTAGKFIKSVTSVTLSATTGTAGNFGITCTRQCTIASFALANKSEIFDWQMLGLPQVQNSACLQMLMTCSTTSTGAIRGAGKILHG
jgi:hypothetical protein